MKCGYLAYLFMLFSEIFAKAQSLLETFCIVFGIWQGLLSLISSICCYIMVWQSIYARSTYSCFFFKKKSSSEARRRGWMLPTISHLSKVLLFEPYFCILSLTPLCPIHPSMLIVNECLCLLYLSSKFTS
jgi:hypothetical protein